MARTCTICGDEVSGSGIARCMVPHCPEKQEVSGARVLRLLIPLLVLATILVAVTVATVSMMSPAAEPANPFAAAADNGFAAADTSQAETETARGDAASGATGGGIAIPAGLFGPADPRAATRVQTFSCDSAAISPARRLVCNHWELATVDYNLALAYRRALANVANPSAVRREQRVWLQTLDRQRDATRIFQHYRTRLDRLSKADG